MMINVADIADVYQGLARSGRGAGVRPGDWTQRIVESGDIRDDGWLDLDGLREVSLVQNARTERHLLRPYDVVVTARAGSVQAALVPPQVSRTVANVTLLVVRSHQPELGMGHYLWYYLTSTFGRAQVANRLTTSATVVSLSAVNLGSVELPVPSRNELEKVVRLVEASEEAYTAAIDAAQLRRQVLRDSIIQDIAKKPGNAL